MQSNMKLPFTVLCAVPFIMVLGNSMLIPLLPKMRAVLDLSLMEVGLLITVFSLPAGLTIPIAGYLSDRYSRKIVMAPALVLYGIGGLIAGAAALLLDQPYTAIIAGRIVQGIGAGGTYQLAMALTGDIFQSQERAKTLGLLEASNGLGKVVSPIAGAALGLIAWFVPFFVYGLLAIPVAVALWLLVKEPSRDSSQQRQGKQYFQQLMKIFQQKGVSLGACFAAGMVVLFILFGVLSYLSDLLKSKYDIGGFTTGLLIAIPVGSMAITSYLAGSYLQKQTANMLKLAVIAGLVLVAASLGVFAFFTNLYVSFLALIAMGTGTGMALPALNTLITSAAATQERGIVTCLYGSMRFFGVAMGPPAFGLTASLGRLPVFLAGSGVVVLVVVLAVWLIQTRTLVPPGLLAKS